MGTFKRPHSFQDVVDFLDGRESKRIKNNTYLQVRAKAKDGTPVAIALRHHQTDILEYAEKSIYYDNGGYNSKSTRERINDYSPLYIQQRNWQWFIRQPDNSLLLFHTGIISDYEGNTTFYNEARALDMALAHSILTKEIEAYVENMTQLYLYEGVSLCGEYFHTPTRSLAGLTSDKINASHLYHMLVTKNYHPSLLWYGAAQKQYTRSFVFMTLRMHHRNGYFTGDVEDDGRLVCNELKRFFLAAFRPQLLDNEDNLLRFAKKLSRYRA